METSPRELQKLVNKDPRSRKASKPLLFCGVMIAVGFIAFIFFGSITSPSAIIERLAMVGWVSILIGVVLIWVFLIRYLIVQKKIRAEVLAKFAREEEESLAKIRATMTPAEWEAYKLQLENNKLLKDIKKRTSRKSTTTTTYGFVDGG